MTQSRFDWKFCFNVDIPLSQKSQNEMIKTFKYKKLFNSKLFVNDIENAYQKVWENYLNGNKIADIFI